MAVFPGPWAGVNATVPAYTPPPEFTVFPGPWTAVNAVVPSRVAVNWWTITDGEREPIYVRERLTPQQDRKRLVWGEFLPDADTTGVYDESKLQIINENVTITTAGFVLKDKWVRGRLSVAAPNVKTDNVRVTGPSSGPADGALITATNAAVNNLVIEDTEVYPEHPNDRINCIQGHHFTLRRVNAHHGVDIVGIIGQLSDSRVDVVMESPWLHDMVMSNTDTQPTDNITHNDLIQWHGLLGLYLLGARLEAFCDPAYGVVTQPPVWNGEDLISGNPNYPWQTGFSAIMASPARKLMGDFEMRKSWVDGGAVGLNWGGPTQALFPDGGLIEDSFFGTGFRVGPDFGLLTKSFRTHQIARNYRWNKAAPFDTSTSFNPRKNG